MIFRGMAHSDSCPCPNLNGDLAKPHLTLEHGWVIIFHSANMGFVTYISLKPLPV